MVEAAAQQGADLGVINRFGKREVTGKGLIELIQQAADADTPALTWAMCAFAPGQGCTTRREMANNDACSMSTCVWPFRGSHITHAEEP
jgi:hypothetical protein